METTAKYRLMGAFTLATIVGIFGFVYWLNHGAGFGERSTYQIRFVGPVPGLRPGATVQFNGIRVGEVTNLQLDTNMPQQVLATISIDRGTPVRTDTQVTLDFQGLMGVTSIALKGGAAQAPSLTGTAGTPALLVASASAGDDLASTARGALRRLDVMLADNSDALRSTISNLNIFTNALAKNSNRIDSIITGLERLVGGDTKSPALSFDLTAPKVFPPFDNGTRELIAVAEPTALLALDTQKLLLRSPNGPRTQIPGNAQWADILTKLVHARILQTLENATSSATVSRLADNPNASRQLQTDIRSFEVTSGEQPFATVEFAAKMVGEGNRVLDARSFSATAPATSADAPAAAAALDRAFATVATEMAVWARGVH